MRFSQNVRGPLDLSFSAIKGTHQWTNFPAKVKKHLAQFGHNEIISKKSGFSTFIIPPTVTSPEKTEQSHDPIPRTLHYRDGRTDERHFIEPNSLCGGSKLEILLEAIQRKVCYGRTDACMDKHEFIGPISTFQARMNGLPRYFPGSGRVCGGYPKSGRGVPRPENLKRHRFYRIFFYKYSRNTRFLPIFYRYF